MKTSDLTSLRPADLESVSDGDFKVWFGTKLESLERSVLRLDGSYSALDRRISYLAVGVFTTLAATLLSVI